MKNVLWFVVGVAGGFIAAHYVNKDPRGHELLGEVDARITQFADRISDAYREQESRIAGIVSDALDAAADTASAATAAAVDATETAREKLAD